MCNLFIDYAFIFKQHGIHVKFVAKELNSTFADVKKITAWPPDIQQL